MKLCSAIALLLAANAQVHVESPCSICFFGPDNLAFDRAHHVYVVDTDHQHQSRILKLTEEGRKLAEWTPFRFVADKENGPEGIAIDRDGFIWVTDGGALQVLKLTPHGVVVMRVGGPGIFHDLGHVAVDAKRLIYVSEGGANRIDVFSSSGQLLHQWTRESGASARDWKRPEGLAVLPDGRLVVEDWGNRRLIAMSSDGVTQTVWGGAGKDSGQWVNSAGIFATGDGKILVADIAQHSIDVLSPSGNFAQWILDDAGKRVFHNGPSSVAQAPDGSVYAADGKSIVKFDPTGAFQARWQ